MLFFILLIFRKLDTRIDGPWELGQHDGQGRRNDVESCVALMLQGKSPGQILEENPTLYFKRRKQIREFYFDNSARRVRGEFRKICVFVLQGPSRTGKTRFAMNYKPTDTFKINQTSGTKQIWFDGYEGESVLVIDDFEGWIDFRELLNLLDGYPLRLPIKGSHTWAAWTVIFITTNVAMHHWYLGRMDLSPLEARITETYEYPTDRPTIEAINNFIDSNCDSE